MDVNVQPIEKQEHHAKGDLGIINVWLTIQGEGPLAGKVAVFIRLAGCNLDCPLCDTDYTTGRETMQVPEIVKQVMRVADGKTNLVVITGGEPFRQNIKFLASSLLMCGMRVQIETNGTLYVPDFPYSKVTIVCSPKTPLLNSYLLPHISAYKYVVGHFQVDDADGLPTYVLGKLCRVARPPADFDKDQVYVQPMDEQDLSRNAQHIRTAVDSCFRHGWRMCIQMHKLLGLP